MRDRSWLSSSGMPAGSNRANLRNCITVRVMTKQQRVYLLAGSSLVDLARRKGTPFLYFSTVAFWNANVSRSKRKLDPAALLATRATATKTPSCQKPADVCQLLQITSRTRRSGRGFGCGEIFRTAWLTGPQLECQKCALDFREEQCRDFRRSNHSPDARRLLVRGQFHQPLLASANPA